MFQWVPRGWYEGQVSVQIGKARIRGHEEGGGRPRRRARPPRGLPVLGETPIAGAAARQRAARRAAAVQAARAGGALPGRDFLLGLRHRGNPDRAAAVLRLGRVHPDPAVHAGDPAGPAAGDPVVPRSGHGLHPARRLVRGRPAELRAENRAGVRGRPAHRLHRDGRGADGRGHGRHRVDVPGHRPLRPWRSASGSCCCWLRQPARDQGGRAVLRHPDLPVLRVGHPHDRGRADPADLLPPADAGPARPARHDQGAPRVDAGPRGDGLHLPARLRQRRRVADRHRGGVGRGGRAPAAGGTQRPPGAGRRRPDPRVPGGRHFLAGPRHSRHPPGKRLPHRAGPGGGH